MKEKNQPKVEELKKRIKKIKEERSSYVPLLNFFEKLFSAELNHAPHITLDDDDLREDLALIKIREGFPLLRKEKITVDLGSSEKNFQTLCRIAEKENRELEDAVKEIREALQIKKINLKRLFENCIREEVFLSPELESLNLPLLSLLLRHSVQPSLRAIASRLKHLINEDFWEKGYCPICGSPPFFSALRGEEGERIFFCSYCSHEWKGRRLSCPFCENTDPQSLRYLYIEKESEYRIDLCEKCKKYIKTVDTRKLGGPIFPELEDISTLHLDILAEEEGFAGIRSIKNLFFENTPSCRTELKGENENGF